MNKLNTFTLSEVFASIEGEAMYTGYPTIFVRFAGCNLKCQGFNNPENFNTSAITTLGFDPKNYKKLNDIPPIRYGCDSIYSWDKQFKHLWITKSTNELANMIMQEKAKISDTEFFFHPITYQPIILSLTGGEPILWQDKIPFLLNHAKLNYVNTLLIETNCSVPITDQFIDHLNYWTTDLPPINPILEPLSRVAATPLYKRQVVWSNSPKTSASGENITKTIVPAIAKQQLKVIDSIQYFKFVVDNNPEHFDEIEHVMRGYYEYDIPKNTPVYIMPNACTNNQQNDVATEIALKTLELGYLYCDRVQLRLFDSSTGT